MPGRLQERWHASLAGEAIPHSSLSVGMQSESRGWPPSPITSRGPDTRAQAENLQAGRLAAQRTAQPRLRIIDHAERRQAATRHFASDRCSCPTRLDSKRSINRCVVVTAAHKAEASCETNRTER